MKAGKRLEHRVKCKACGGRMRVYCGGKDGVTRYLECGGCGRRVKAVLERTTKHTKHTKGWAGA